MDKLIWIILLIIVIIALFFIGKTLVSVFFVDAIDAVTVQQGEVTAGSLFNEGLNYTGGLERGQACDRAVRGLCGPQPLAGEIEMTRWWRSCKCEAEYWYCKPTQSCDAGNDY